MPRKHYPPFRFKQFTMEHDKSSMKLGVDGVLLACWTNLEEVQSILDVGAGCGIISVVCAQRNQEAKIHAVEIEDNAFEEASLNFINAPWSDRLSISHEPFQEHLKRGQSLFSPYDLIISNPPFFIDSLASQKDGRSLARHNVNFDFDLFFELCSQSLSEQGKVSIVFPHDKIDFLKEKAEAHGLYISRLANVKPFEHRPPKRVLLEFTKTQMKIEEETFAVEIERGNYTEKYSGLVGEFYLYF